jgi:hypothetical protein
MKSQEFGLWIQNSGFSIDTDGVLSVDGIVLLLQYSLWCRDSQNTTLANFKNCIEIQGRTLRTA